jgi:hypothetical protein
MAVKMQAALWVVTSCSGFVHFQDEVKTETFSDTLALHHITAPCHNSEYPDLKHSRFV